MSQELLYTSAPRGLKPGSRGFCTVLSTQGMAAPLATALEGLSGYRPIYPASDDLAARNPVVYSHLKLQMGGRAVHVLSRVADFGMDYSQRANKLAHHVVLDKPERSPVGPATLITAPGVMRDDWDGEPKVVALKSIKPVPSPPTGVCQAWQRLAGDAGWAGVLAESFLHDPERLVILTFSPGQEILPLFAEALSLLPPERRWEVTFSTYFTGLAPATTCIWRALVHDSKEAHESLRFVNALRLNLTSGSLGLATGGPLVDAARSGVCLYPASQNATSQPAKGDEVFSEFADSHIEFAADESESRAPHSAGPPQLPSRTAASPATHVTNTSPHSKKRRTLADVVKAESNRPSRTRLWIAVTVAVLTITATLGLAFATGRLQFVLSKLRPAPNSKGLNGNTPSATMTAVVTAPQSGRNPVPKAPLPTPLPASVPGGGDAEASPPMTDADVAETTAESAPGDRMESEKDVPPAPKNEADPRPATSGHHQEGSLAPQLVILPSKGDKSTLLHEIPVPPGFGIQESPHDNKSSLPRFILLIPEWNIYKFSNSRNSRHGSTSIKTIERRSQLGHEPFAYIVAHAPHNGRIRYNLDFVKDTDIPLLGWCQILVASPHPHQEKKALCFADFPLRSSDLARTIRPNAAPLRWPLAQGAFIAENQTPHLILDRLVVAIDQKQFQCDAADNNAKSSWTLNCTAFEEYVRSKTNSEDTSKNNNTIFIKIELTKDKNKSYSITITTLGVDKLIRDNRKSVNDKLYTSTKELTSACSQSDRGLKSHSMNLEVILAQWLKSDDDREPGEMAAFKDQVGMLRDHLEKENSDLSAIKRVDAALENLAGVVSQVLEFRKVEKSLKNIEITSARIYYVLTGTGDDSSVSVEVDVVNFGDAPAGDAKSGEDRK